MYSLYLLDEDLNKKRLATTYAKDRLYWQLVDVLRNRGIDDEKIERILERRFQYEGKSFVGKNIIVEKQDDYFRIEHDLDILLVVKEFETANRRSPFIKRILSRNRKRI